MRIRKILGLLACLASAPIAFGQAGTLITNVNLPVTGNGVSVAVDCSGNVYYTLASTNNLIVMDKAGVLITQIPVVDASTGAALFMDEMAYDSARGVLWACLHGSNPVKIYHVDPATGLATFQWDSATISIGTFRDGLAYDASDDSLWVSGDVSTTIEHHMANGTFLGAITPKNAAGADLGLISGVSVGIGDLLYLGRNGAQQIVQVKKSDGTFISVFASPGGARDEGLECDTINFAPKVALWSREFNAPGFMSVIELEPDTCSCGGQQTVTYCTSKKNSLGCFPMIGSTGAPSASAMSGFTLLGMNERNNKRGILLHGTTGRDARTFQRGFLCMKPPILVTPTVNAGGNPPPADDCSGVFMIDMNAFAAGVLGGSPNPALSIPGTVVDCQWWGRDRGGFYQTSLSDALEYTVAP